MRRVQFLVSATCLSVFLTGTLAYLLLCLDFAHGFPLDAHQSNQPHSAVRQKRSVIALAKMIQAVIPTHLATDYNGYGNYCGVGGSGEVLDIVDRCCASHDHCYNQLAKKQCARQTGFKKYFVSYNWRVVAAQNGARSVVCEPPDPKKPQFESDCGSGLCDCDQIIVSCFLQNDASFNPKLVRRRSILSSILQYVREFFEPPANANPLDALTEMQLAKNASAHAPLSGSVMHDIINLDQENGPQPAKKNAKKTETPPKKTGQPSNADKKSKQTTTPPKFAPPVQNPQQNPFQPPFFNGFPPNSQSAPPRFNGGTSPPNQQPPFFRNNVSPPSFQPQTNGFFPGQQPPNFNNFPPPQQQPPYFNNVGPPQQQQPQFNPSNFLPYAFNNNPPGFPG